ncbi:MAG: ammonium transporter [Halobacteriovoraceae bacterium]|nr:ammonium transporter [Halobacteriovoraceae bacterium]
MNKNKPKKGLWLLFLLCPLILVIANTAQAVSSPETKYIFNNFMLLFSAALVMLMAAGFCMLESGLVRTKSTAVICLKNIVIYAVACLAYFVIGYNLMYIDVDKYIGSFSFFTLPTPSEMELLGNPKNTSMLPNLHNSGVFSLTNVFFQMVFVATTASIISGALAERIRLWPFFIFILVLTAFIYPVVGAWTWGNGWLAQMGFKDFAGSTIVHSVGGWAALMGILFVGPRTGKYKKNGKVTPTPASNVTLVTLGTFILWFGWIGFNGGSVLALDSTLNAATMGLVVFNTNLAAVGGVIVAMFLGVFIYKRVQILWILNGAIGGLVAITAGPDIPNPVWALFIGAVGGLLATLAVPIMDKLKIDDVVGAIPAHLVSGIWGTLAVGIFSDTPFFVQALGIVCIGAFVLLTSFATWFILKLVMGLRVSKASEFLGQDVSELGVEAYPEFLNLDGLQGKEGL